MAAFGGKEEGGYVETRGISSLVGSGGKEYRSLKSIRMSKCVHSDFFWLIQGFSNSDHLLNFNS